MVLARACSVTVSDSSSNLASALLASVMVTLPAAPLAMPITQSLVEVSPSTVIWLKLRVVENGRGSTRYTQQQRHKKQGQCNV
jgi:hypothetical protein